MDDWRKRGPLGKDTRRRDIDTTNTVLARCYGLRKIHKENYPLRLIISTINTPTRFLEQNLKGLDFIMNSTKFKFNGQFYEKKFGTPIGSVISSMLAEIVMEDLERSVFEKLGFVLPFYFRYVDDTFLCVPLDKLQIVIDTFNEYHPRIQFTHEIERNNRISFLDLEIIKLDNDKIVSNWYKSSTYSGRLLNSTLNHPFQNKVAVIKNLVDRAICLSHGSFHSIC